VSESIFPLNTEIQTRPSRSQKIDWFPSRWTTVFENSKFADRLSQLIPSNVAEDDRASIKREQIYEKRDEDPTLTFLATMIWGRGPDNRGPKLTLRMMNDDRFDDTIEELASGAKSSSPPDAFRTLFTKGRARLPRLGVSFGTKVIHAFGYKESGLQPLVYDVLVFKALQFLNGKGEFPYEPQHPWRFMSSESYGRYCDWAAKKASDLASEPADVECALFNLGKRLSRESG